MLLVAMARISEDTTPPSINSVRLPLFLPNLTPLYYTLVLVATPARFAFMSKPSRHVSQVMYVVFLVTINFIAMVTLH